MRRKAKAKHWNCSLFSYSPTKKEEIECHKYLQTIKFWFTERKANKLWVMIWGCRGLQALHDFYLSCVFQYLDSLKYIQNRLCRVFWSYLACTELFLLSLIKYQHGLHRHLCNCKTIWVCCNYWLHTHTRVPLLHSFLNLIMFTDDPLATHKNRDKYLHNCLYCEQHSHRALIHCLVPKIVSNSQEAAYSSGFPLLALHKQITENEWGKLKTMEFKDN